MPATSGSSSAPLAQRVDRRVRIGVGSHNLFDIAWAVLLAEERGVLGDVEFEMLEGMAGAEAEALRRRVGAVRLYTPITRAEHRSAAIAYLVRRLEENTTAGNFLREAFDLDPNSAAFAAQAEAFATAVDDRHRVSTVRRRRPIAPDVRLGFVNEPDTDVVVPEQRRAVLAALGADEASAGEGDEPAERSGIDRGIDEAAVDLAVALAAGGQRRWGARSPADRGEVLRRAADLLAAERHRTVALIARSCAKTPAEADIEVSEAIDFVRYYAESAQRLADEVRSVDGSPVGVVVVAPPWNFPYAIPTGGVIAGLAAGNAVILKPAPEAVEVSRALVEQLHRAGIPSDVVQFLPCPDGDVGRHLIAHPEIASGDPHRRLLDRPDLRRLAPRAAAAGRDQRQERDRDHRCRRPRRSGARPGPLGVRARRAEVLGGEPGDRRGVGARRAGLPPATRRRRAQPPRRGLDRAGDVGAPTDPSGRGDLAAGVEHARARRGVAGRAGPAVERAGPLVAGGPSRRPTRLVDPPHGVRSAQCSACCAPPTWTPRWTGSTTPSTA